MHGPSVCRQVVKSISERERSILGVYGFVKGMWYDRSAWYVADAKSVWSWRKIVKALKSFYVDSRACVWVRNDVSEWFPVNIGLRQCCVMSPWLFNVYKDGVVREVNVMVLGKGLNLLSANGGRFEINQCCLQRMQY